MAISREDQNTFIMIAGVMIVCLIALCAVFNTIWQIIRVPVTNFVDSVGTTIRLQSLNYNFDIPETDDIPTPTPTEPQFPSDILSYPDALYTINEMNELSLSGQTPVQKNLKIAIPSINVSANLYQGEPSEEFLKEGFWVSPTESELGDGETVFFCNRRFFGPNDLRGCWNIDKINRTDRIVINFETVALEYQVVGINIFEADDPLIYQVNPDKDQIKIVTTHPLESNSQRFVVLAERVK